jgi:hypothetical protein
MVTDRHTTADRRDTDKRPKPFSRRIDKQGSKVLALGGTGGLKGTSREARFIKAYEKELIEFLGGDPNFIQRQQIVRAARLACHVQLWDEATLGNGGAAMVNSAHSYNHYTSWTRSLAAILRDLGAQEWKPAEEDPFAILRSMGSGQRDAAD